MNLKVPGAILPLGCAILSTRAKTVRGVGTTALRRTRVNKHMFTNPFSCLFVLFVCFCLFYEVVIFQTYEQIL